jgi:hypothetical protein
MKEKRCCLCGDKIKGYGNNAQPVEKGICCDECNKVKVIPARIMERIHR